MAITYSVDVGNWYRTPSGRLFEVVSLDAETIEVQYDDGDLEELDQEAWLDIKPAPSSPPVSALLPFDMENDESFAPDRQSLYELLGDVEFTD
ncbi:MAG: hypothetical protein IPK65_12585 [Gammaproteobacteria bacterium]|nr:hypothetical protein [Gammaproteobacteria bacterium]